MLPPHASGIHLISKIIPEHVVNEGYDKAKSMYRIVTLIHAKVQGRFLCQSWSNHRTARTRRECFARVESDDTDEEHLEGVSEAVSQYLLHALAYRLSERRMDARRTQCLCDFRKSWHQPTVVDGSQRLVSPHCLQPSLWKTKS